MTTRMMLADDHRMLREGLRRALSDHGLDVVGEARDGAEAIHLAAEVDPDAILMDVTMPELDGIEATRQIKAIMPRVEVVMLSMHSDQDTLAAAVRAGASGYLVKSCAAEEIAAALRLAVSGEIVLSPPLAASTFDEFRCLEPGGDDRSRLLTKTEEDLLQLIANSDAPDVVAQRLHISQRVAKEHLSSIYRKLEERREGGGGTAALGEPRRPLPPSDSGPIRLSPPATGED